MNALDAIVVSVEFSVLTSERVVDLGCNARLPVHGRTMLDPVCRLTCSNGVSGWGWTSMAARDEARSLIGLRVSELISQTIGVSERGRRVEAALWDLLGKLLGVPVFRLLGATSSSASVYFTHLYFSDLHLKSDQEACQLLEAEAKVGVAQGHTAFKMKGFGVCVVCVFFLRPVDDLVHQVGRGAMHMPLVEGTRRDISLIKAVRSAIGPHAVLMIDANNGWNLNLAKEVLLATRECNIFWLEEGLC